MKASMCALAVAVAFPSAAAAQAMQKVEVTGARQDQRREETAAAIIIGPQELQRQGDRTLADALKRVPGITIGEGGGRAGEIRMRGLGNGYTQVLLNGVAVPPGFNVESLAPELVENGRRRSGRGGGWSRVLDAVAACLPAKTGGRRVARAGRRGVPVDDA